MLISTINWFVSPSSPKLLEDFCFDNNVFNLDFM